MINLRLPKTLKYALMVFIGGLCYGAMTPITRASLDFGFSPGNAIITHNLFASIILIPIVLIFFRRKISRKDVLGLLGLSIPAFAMSACFYYALLYITASLTLTLMFQYIWMGIIIQAIVERRLPRLPIVLGGATVIIGTVLATGVLEEGITLHPMGVFLGLSSALGYALFLFFSGRVATKLPAATRAMFVSTVRLFIAVAMAPGTLVQLPELPIFVLFGVPMALLGIVIPLVLIQTAAPHLPNSVTTIMSASELPGGILLTIIFIGEYIGLVRWSGIALVFCGIVLSQIPELRELIRRVRTRKPAKTS